MNCPECSAFIPDESRFCNMCGCNIADALAKVAFEKRQIIGEEPLFSKTFSTPYGSKNVLVYCRSITQFEKPIDLLITSAFPGKYWPKEKTVMHALYNDVGIDLRELAVHPVIDLRESFGCWISEPIDITEQNRWLHRIGIIESQGRDTTPADFLKKLTAFFQILDIATDNGMEMEAVAIPVLATGDQKVEINLILATIIDQALSFLQRNPRVKTLYFVEIDIAKAKALATELEAYKSWSFDKPSYSKPPLAFISFSSRDKDIAEKVRNRLDCEKITPWIMYDDIKAGTNYASKMLEGINDCTHFICLISDNSMESQYVETELALAFRRVNEGIKLLPFMLTNHPLRDSFKVFLELSQQYKANGDDMDACIDQFIKEAFSENGMHQKEDK